MVAHVVKTEKSAQLRATFLLFGAIRSPFVQLSLCENTLQQGSGNRAIGVVAHDYKTRAYRVKAWRASRGEVYS